MSEPERDDELDPVLQDYIAAFVEIDRPSDASRRQTWTALDEATRPAVRWRVVGAIGAIAAIAAAMLLMPRTWSVGPARRAEPDLTEAPYESESRPDTGELRTEGTRLPNTGELRSEGERRLGTGKLRIDGAPGIERVRIDGESRPGTEERRTDESRPNTDELRTDEETRLGTDEHPTGGAPGRALQVVASAPAISGPSASLGPKPARPSIPEPSRPDTEAETTLPRSTLAEQTAALRAIQQALIEGRPAEALALVEDSRHRFPMGIFIDEITVAQAQAFCDLGRSVQAREAVNALSARNPRSPLLTRARRICPSSP